MGHRDSDTRKSRGHKKHKSHRDRSRSKNRSPSHSISHSRSRSNRRDQKVRSPRKKHTSRRSPSKESKITSSITTTNSTKAPTHFSSVTTLLESSSGKRVFLPAPIIIDESGREIDGTGRIIQKSVKAPSTLLINQKKFTSKSVNPYLAQIETALKTQNEDKRIRSSNRLARQERGLKFRKQGSIIKKAESIRAKEVRQLITEKQRQSAVEEYQHEPIPEIIKMSDIFIPNLEWWEGPFLDQNKRSDFKYAKEFDHDYYSYDDIKVENWENINLIHHPVPPPCPLPKEVNKSLPLKLTKEEQKRKRRIEKMERIKEQNELIQVGIRPPPEPKLKPSNVLSLYKDEVIANPSKIEKMVQDQVAQRLMNHQKRNEERKLTPIGKKRKIEQKKIGDITGQKFCAVFRVDDLSNVQHRFKVDVNATQLHIKGRVVLCPTIRVNMIFVEGTEKAIKNYTKLMTKRIQWNINKIENATFNNKCVLIWSGVSNDIKFDGFKVQEYPSSQAARDSLEVEGLSQYWDMTRNYQEPE